MHKVLIMVRASTDRQHIEEQHTDMVEFCKREGYAEEDMIFVEDKGASAIKLNESYKIMLAQVKENIENNADIDCFAVWELSRAFRNELCYYEMKEFLVNRGIQFLCRTPNLRLLDDNGKINSGMEIAMSLYATLAKQEMETKKERFHRGKSANSKIGKYNGGPVKFGYKVDANNYCVIDEPAAKAIRTIYELYATGNYSYVRLFEEIQERGITKPDGSPISVHAFNKILSDTAYIGYTHKVDSNRTFPPIISNELWEKVRKQREDTRWWLDRKDAYPIGQNLIICPCCGTPMSHDVLRYRCLRHAARIYKVKGMYCPNTQMINKEMMDALIWEVASYNEAHNMFDNNEQHLESLKSRLDVFNQKEDALFKKLSGVENKKQKVIDSYIDGLIDKSERDRRLKKIDNESKDMRSKVLSIEEQIEKIQELMNRHYSNCDKLLRVLDRDKELMDADAKTKQEIARRNITKIELGERVWLDDGQHRAKVPNAVELIFHLTDGHKLTYIYVPRGYQGYRIFDRQRTPLYK